MNLALLHILSNMQSPQVQGTDVVDGGSAGIFDLVELLDGKKVDNTSQHAMKETQGVMEDTPVEGATLWGIPLIQVYQDGVGGGSSEDGGGELTDSRPMPGNGRIEPAGQNTNSDDKGMDISKAHPEEGHGDGIEVEDGRIENLEGEPPEMELSEDVQDVNMDDMPRRDGHKNSDGVDERDFTRRDVLTGLKDSSSGKVNGKGTREQEHIYRIYTAGEELSGTDDTGEPVEDGTTQPMHTSKGDREEDGAFHRRESSTGDGRGMRINSGTEPWNRTTHTERTRASEAQARIRGSDIFDRISDAVRMSVTRGGREVRIVVEPPELGHLKIKLTLDNDTVNARIVVDSPHLRNFLEGDSQRLRMVFAQQGLILDRYSVELGTPHDGRDQGRDFMKERDGYHYHGDRRHGSLESGTSPYVELPHLKGMCQQGGIDIFV